MQGTVPQSVLALLRLREGCRADVYVDTTGNATCGIGHKLLPSETHRFEKGMVMPEVQIEKWFSEDAESAYSAATVQAHLIGSIDARLIDGLTPVCFQLGQEWYHEFPKTWELLLDRQWEAAATEVQLGSTPNPHGATPAHVSDWYAETPVRVEDFQAALRSLSTPAATGVATPVATPVAIAANA